MAQGQADGPQQISATPDVSDAAALISQGLALFRRRRFADAALAFKRAAEQAPDAAAAQFLQARALLLARDYQNARLVCQNALELTPESLRGHLLMTRIALSSRNQMLAQTHLAKAIALRPRSADLLAKSAELFADRSRFKKARETAQEACDLDPRCFAARLVIVRCEIAGGELESAQALLGELERERPNWPALAKARGLLRQRLNARSPGRPTPTAAPESTSDEELRAALPALDAEEPAAATPQAIERASIISAFRRGPDASEVEDGAPAAAKPPGAEAPVYDPLGVDRSRWSWSAPNVLDHIFVVRALIVRNLRMKYGNNPLRLTAELARPTAIVLAHVILFTVLRRPMPGNVPIPVFVLGGFSVWFAFNAMETGASTGALHAGGILALNAVTGMHLRVAKALWPFLVNLAFCLVALAPLNLYGADFPTPNLSLTIFLFCITGVMGFGFGLLFEQLNRFWSMAKVVEKLFVWAIFVSMGLYFSVAHTRPPILAQAMLYNPLLHIVEYERHAFDPGYPVSQVDLSYPIVVAAIVLLSGLVAMKCLPAEE